MLIRRLRPSYSSQFQHPPEDSESPLGRRLPWRVSPPSAIFHGDLSRTSMLHTVSIYQAIFYRRRKKISSHMVFMSSRLLLDP